MTPTRSAPSNHRRPHLVVIAHGLVDHAAGDVCPPGKAVVHAEGAATRGKERYQDPLFRVGEMNGQLSGADGVPGDPGGFGHGAGLHEVRLLQEVDEHLAQLVRPRPENWLA